MQGGDLRAPPPPRLCLARAAPDPTAARAFTVSTRSDSAWRLSFSACAFAALLSTTSFCKACAREPRPLPGRARRMAEIKTRASLEASGATCWAHAGGHIWRGEMCARSPRGGRVARNLAPTSASESSDSGKTRWIRPGPVATRPRRRSSSNSELCEADPRHKFGWPASSDFGPALPTRPAPSSRTLPRKTLPAELPHPHQSESDDPALPGNAMNAEDAPRYRAMVARCNFLESDRPDNIPQRKRQDG